MTEGMILVLIMGACSDLLAKQVGLIGKVAAPKAM